MPLETNSYLQKTLLLLSRVAATAFPHLLLTSHFLDPVFVFSLFPVPLLILPASHAGVLIVHNCSHPLHLLSRFSRNRQHMYPKFDSKKTGLKLLSTVFVLISLLLTLNRHLLSWNKEFFAQMFMIWALVNTLTAKSTIKILKYYWRSIQNYKIYEYFCAFINNFKQFSYV